MKLNQLILIGLLLLSTKLHAGTIEQDVEHAHNYGHHEADGFEAALIRNDTAFTNSLIRENNAETDLINQRGAKERADAAAENYGINEQRYRDRAIAIVAQQAAKAVAQVDQIDDDVTIKAYLESYGYKNVGPIEIDKVRAYLSQHGLKHVTEIGQ